MKTSKKFIETSEGEKIATVIHHPHGESKGTILLQHGLFSNKDGSWKLRAEYLAEEGFKAIRFDRRGYGESDREFIDFTLSLGIEDSITLLDFFENECEEKFAIFGSSFGGLIGIHAASRDDRIDALSLRSPVTYTENILPDLRARVRRQKKVEIGELQKGEMSQKFFEDLDSYDTEKIIDEIETPTLIFHGNEDDIVQIGDSRKFYRKLNVEKEFIEVKDEGHVFSIENNQKVLEKTATWFSKHIQ